MSRNRKLGVLKPPQTTRTHSVTLWKKAALCTVSVALVLGLMGCDLNDLLTPFGGGEIPFEQTKPTSQRDMGAVDNIPTVPDHDSFLDNDDFPILTP